MHGFMNSFWRKMYSAIKTIIGIWVLINISKELFTYLAIITFYLKSLYHPNNHKAKFIHFSSHEEWKWMEEVRISCILYAFICNLHVTEKLKTKWASALRANYKIYMLCRKWLGPTIGIPSIQKTMDHPSNIWQY